MQNKANLPDTQMNASYVKTKNYEQNTMEEKPAKQSQNKPNQSQFMVSMVEPLVESLVEPVEGIANHLFATGGFSRFGRSVWPIQ
jgi:hypothetical protein